MTDEMISRSDGEAAYDAINNIIEIVLQFYADRTVETPASLTELAECLRSVNLELLRYSQEVDGDLFLRMCLHHASKFGEQETLALLDRVDKEDVIAKAESILHHGDHGQ